MTYEELVDCITKSRDYTSKQEPDVCMKEELNALLAVVELHKPKNYIIKGFEVTESWCTGDSESLSPYPCATIQAIEKELL